jgi:hypothetical protein
MGISAGAESAQVTASESAKQTLFNRQWESRLPIAKFAKKSKHPKNPFAMPIEN